ncbi:MAG: hypothetical protein JNM36_05285 [Chitinophagales bacterium]|nr:hypothetical protein [Chitinophagales bacterium]
MSIRTTLVVLVTVLVSLYSGHISAQTECKKMPNFVQKMGYDPNRVAFSTSEKHIMGIVLIELNPQTGQRNKQYQHSSWKEAGYMSGIAIDENGNVYAVPAPTVNILYNKPEDQNYIYKMDANTGEMSRFVELPATAEPSNHNPYGTLGIYYDCDTHHLFVTSILGSTQTAEKGRIFAVDVQTKKVSVVVDKVDAMGIGMAQVEGTRWLVYGKTRESAIFGMPLDRNNQATASPTMLINLDNMGPRGDDHARKIRYTQGALQVNATSFYYNLTAPTEKPETIYIYMYDATQKQWRLVRYE